MRGVGIWSMYSWAWPFRDGLNILNNYGIITLNIYKTFHAIVFQLEYDVASG